MKAANPEHFQEIPVLANFIEEVSPQPSQLGDNVAHALPSAPRPSVNASTSDNKVAKTTGTKRKSTRRKPKRQSKSSKYDNVIGNTSPVDNTDLPDIILSLNDSEYFSSDDEVEILDSDSSDSYDSPAY